MKDAEILLLSYPFILNNKNIKLKVRALWFLFNPY